MAAVNVRCPGRLKLGASSDDLSSNLVELEAIRGEERVIPIGTSVHQQQGGGQYCRYQLLSRYERDWGRR